ncbi:MAG: hypothetical protein AAF604_17000 [Acidobacteriota bacterium]
MTLARVCALAIATLMATSLAAAPEFRVNLNADAKQREATVAYDRDGGCLMVWRNLRHGLSARYFPADGAASDEILLVGNRMLDSNPGEGYIFVRRDPAIALHPSGDFYLFWTEERSYMRAAIFHEEITVLEQDVLGQRFHADGTPAAARFRVHRERAGWQSRPQVAMASDGAFLVAWQSYDPETSRETIEGRRFTARGAAAGGTIRIDDGQGGRARSPQIARTDAGVHLIVWATRNDDDRNARGRLLNARGQALGSSFELHPESSDLQSSPAVATSGDRFLAVWHGAIDEPLHYRIFGQVIASDGAFRGPVLEISSGEHRAHAYPTVDAAADGTFVAGWLAWMGDLQSSANALRLNADGSPAGDPIRLNEHRLASQSLALATAPNGDFMAAWEGYTDDDFGISGRLVEGAANARVKIPQGLVSPAVAP